MGELTLWERIMHWLWKPYVLTQCKAQDQHGNWCQRRFWHRGEHEYWNGF